MNEDHDTDREEEDEHRKPSRSPLERRAKVAMADWLAGMSPAQRAKVEAALAKAGKGKG